jgi:hypothetical protein
MMTTTWSPSRRQSLKLKMANFIAEKLDIQLPSSDDEANS